MQCLRGNVHEGTFGVHEMFAREHSMFTREYSMQNVPCSEGATFRATVIMNWKTTCLAVHGDFADIIIGYKPLTTNLSTTKQFVMCV